jgi:hypothetical protein
MTTPVADQEYIDQPRLQQQSQINAVHAEPPLLHHQMHATHTATAARQQRM